MIEIICPEHNQNIIGIDFKTQQDNILKCTDCLISQSQLLHFKNIEQIYNENYFKMIIKQKLNDNSIYNAAGSVLSNSNFQIQTIEQVIRDYFNQQKQQINSLLDKKQSGLLKSLQIYKQQCKELQISYSETNNIFDLIQYDIIDKNNNDQIFNQINNTILEVLATFNRQIQTLNKSLNEITNLQQDINNQYTKSNQVIQKCISKLQVQSQDQQLLNNNQYIIQQNIDYKQYNIQNIINNTSQKDNNNGQSPSNNNTFEKEFDNINKNLNSLKIDERDQTEEFKYQNEQLLDQQLNTIESLMQKKMNQIKKVKQKL